jgi:uncharacterized protein YciI
VNERKRWSGPESKIGSQRELGARSAGKAASTTQADRRRNKLPYFVVISEQGPAWNSTRGMRDQGSWSEHAVFMNSLVDDGFVVLGGPIHDPRVHKARLIVRAEDERRVRERLADDPWSKAGLLRVSSIEQWEVLLSRDE